MSDFGNNKGKRSKFAQFKPRKIVKPEQPLEYKNVEYLSKFIGPTGKLQSRRRTGFDGQDQRKLASAVKLARFMGLLPFVGSMQGDVEREPRSGRDRFSRGPRDGESRSGGGGRDAAAGSASEEGE
jgi:small subunit ribosomal protein S18